METAMKTCCQIPVKGEIWNGYRMLRHILRHIIILIVSARESQARRRIQLYFDNRLIDELTAAGTRIAKKDAKD